MRNRSLALFFLFLYTIILLGAGYWMGATAWPLRQLGVPSANIPPEATAVFDPFWEVWNLVNDRYYEQPLDPEQLTQGAIEGMLAQLDDPHTRYLPPADQEAARRAMEGEMEGIGVLVEYVDGNITVVSPFEGSPADKAGIQPGDILRQADGVALTGMDLGEAADLIRGPAGSVVHLIVERDGEQLAVDITRDVIEIPSVRGEMLEEGVGYIRLNRFGNRTVGELEDVLQELLAQEPQGLVLDLRNNPGGGLETAIDVADQFLPEGIVMVERFGGGQERIFTSGDGEPAEEIALVVLINEGSASASEVVAGALRDRERAALVGQTSFGKGTVQTWHSLSNDGGVRITTARWLTPGGAWVNEEGLTPDLVVPPAQPAGEEPSDDNQLDAAIGLLLGAEMGETAH